MNKYFIFIGLIAVILVAGCAQQQASGPAGNATNTAGNTANTTNTGNNNTQPELQVGNFTVEITALGYVPQNLTIKKGSTVTWVNKTSTPNWPASARHPTHTVYPRSGIEKCGTPERLSIFDACTQLGNGDSWSFTFNEVGEWAYHDHVSAKMFGKITVVN